MNDTYEKKDISLLRLFLAWLWIGGTSYGGGSITHYLIQEYFIYKHNWLSAMEYAHILAISQICPGMNIIAISILIGRRLRGGLGIFFSLLGLIIPSVIITILISMIYEEFSSFGRVQRILTLLFAAIFGVSLATNWRNAKPVLFRLAKEGKMTLAITIFFIILLTIVYLLWEPPVLVMYILGGLIGAIGYIYLANRKEDNNL